MIVREIKDDTDNVLSKFDWFNDYKDTRAWAVYSCPDVLPRLDAGYKKYCDDWRSE